MLHTKLTECLLETLDNYNAGGVIPLAVTFNEYGSEDARKAWKEVLETQPQMKELLEQAQVQPEHNMEELAHLPEGTLGKAYWHHIVDNGITPNLHTKSRYIALNKERNIPVEEWRVRLTQVHDLWHVLTGYDISMEGELKIVSFTAAQVPNPYTALIMCIRSLQPVLDHPEQIISAFDAITEGWERGRKAKPLMAIKWEEMWEAPIDEIRREYNLL